MISRTLANLKKFRWEKETNSRDRVGGGRWRARWGEWNFGIFCNCQTVREEEEQNHQAVIVWRNFVSRGLMHQKTSEACHFVSHFTRRFILHRFNLFISSMSRDRKSGTEFMCTYVCILYNDYYYLMHLIDVTFCSYHAFIEGFIRLISDLRNIYLYRSGFTSLNGDKWSI